ncbi:type II toxin-antitoxin system RelE/ParE family toxin [Streptomyces harbinensis]|uniref:type II toxin-antitoxin system RelE family toxin n=1 Tax=Streptomyces harbinensis TaxID=1176198 RepID=UPI0015906997|nr:type II toxin-antitoxin system RelE/ParE family toxin [Streptomyces harbinensis]QKV70195.1 type II toxin-antitoxin system RelE/ParE family toxin [Streptomyces harbinensis]
MKYAFRFTTAAQRQLRAVDQPTAMRILAALTALGDDPYRKDADIKKLSGHEDLYRLGVSPARRAWGGVGAYRVAYTVDDGELVVLVIKVGNRRDVYRGL